MRDKITTFKRFNHSITYPQSAILALLSLTGNQLFHLIILHISLRETRVTIKIKLATLYKNIEEENGYSDSPRR